MYTPEQIEEGNERLLTLATYIARRQSHLKPNGAKRYDQCELFHDCGTPACALGHAFVKFPALYRHGRKACEFFALKGFRPAAEWIEIFGPHGCGDAKRDWRKAVKYIRDFVARRRAAATE